MNVERRFSHESMTLCGSAGERYSWRQIAPWQLPGRPQPPRSPQPCRSKHPGSPQVGSCKRSSSSRRRGNSNGMRKGSCKRMRRRIMIRKEQSHGLCGRGFLALISETLSSTSSTTKLRGEPKYPFPSLFLKEPPTPFSDGFKASSDRGTHVFRDRLLDSVSKQMIDARHNASCHKCYESTERTYLMAALTAAAP